MAKGEKPLETFYLHLCRKDHQVARDQLLFKRILEEDEAIRQKYVYAKHLLEYEFPENRNMYRELIFQQMLCIRILLADCFVFFQYLFKEQLIAGYLMIFAA